ncbi:MAG: sulfatase [Sedimentisphaerales bacterium]|nr:sulfatase [Sedimentisphaerales bacterium]
MTRREFMAAVIAGAGLEAASRFCLARSGQGTARPNFVVIFIDDMGYGDIGPFGSTVNRTPHLDRMAREGMKLTSFYVASPVCSPSRAALLTGCYPRRVGLARGSGHAVLFPGDPHGLHPNEITIAELLKRAGYATGCFGKWHLGDQPQFLPTNQGFDTYFGIPYSNDMWPPHTRWPFPALPILRGTEIVDQVDNMDDQATLCRRFTEEAVAFIKTHRERPFFVYLPHAFVHNPRRAGPKFMAGAKTVEQAQVEEVDWSVGEILRAVRETGIAEKTLVLFTSDNGAAGGLSSGPLRGGKGSAWEGGVREPTLAWWPGTIPAGSVCDKVATAMDLLPTFVTLAGAAAPSDRVIDGKDIRPLLLARPGARSPHESIFYHQGTTLRAVRSGPWKLFRNGSLYHLEDDIGERNNVAADHPDVVQRLTRTMDEFEAEITRNARPIGVAENPRTLLPRPGVEGEQAYAPTLSLPRDTR